MANKQIIIVGQQFAALCDDVRVITYENFQHVIESEKSISPFSNPGRNTYQVYLGQGLSDLEIYFINQFVAYNYVAAQFSFIGNVHHIKRASSDIHSHCVISEPERISEHSFHCALMLDKLNFDETCVANIPAMALIKASMQMMDVVAERFFVSPDRILTKKYTAHQINSACIDHVLPLEVGLFLEIHQLRRGLDENFKAEVSIEIKQNNKSLGSIELEFSVMEKNILLDIEHHLAVLAIDEALERVDSVYVAQCAA